MSRNKRSGRRRGRARRRISLPGMLLLSFAAVALLIGAFLVAGRWLGPSSTAAPASNIEGGTPAISITPPAYDLGQVSQARGIVTVEMALANAGDANLVIGELETSCGCTRAAVVQDGVAGPWFGMRGHGNWPTGWTAHIRPGRQAILRVQYDPNAHGIYRGPIDRVVVIHSNDPRRPRTQVRLSGNQIP